MGRRNVTVIGAPFAYLLAMEPEPAAGRAAGGHHLVPVPRLGGPARQGRPPAADRRDPGHRARPGHVLPVLARVPDAPDPPALRAGRVPGHLPRLPRALVGATPTPEFLDNQLAELRRHRRVASNRLSSAVFYGVAAGCEPAVYGDPMVLDRRGPDASAAPPASAGSGRSCTAPRVDARSPRRRPPRAELGAGPPAAAGRAARAARLAARAVAECRMEAAVAEAVARCGVPRRPRPPPDRSTLPGGEMPAWSDLPQERLADWWAASPRWPPGGAAGARVLVAGPHDAALRRGARATPRASPACCAATPTRSALAHGGAARVLVGGAGRIPTDEQFDVVVALAGLTRLASVEGARLGRERRAGPARRRATTRRPPAAAPGQPAGLHRLVAATPWYAGGCDPAWTVAAARSTRRPANRDQLR